MRTSVIGFVLLAMAASAHATVTVPSTCITCPSGYDRYTIPNAACPVCVKPAKISCGAIAGRPYCCGGDTATPCPTISCAISTTWTSAGSTSKCQTARATVEAFSFSSATYNLKDMFLPVIRDYCTSAADPSQALDAYAVAAVSAYSKAVAKTLIDYSMYACQCSCTNCGGSYASVSADVAAVAKAHASSMIEAIAAVYSEGCFGNPTDAADLPYEATPLAVAYALANGTAIDIKVAYDNLMKQLMLNSKDCVDKCSRTPIVEYAIAEALVCTWVKVLALSRDSTIGETTYACADSLSVSADGVLGKEQMCDFIDYGLFSASWIPEPWRHEPSLCLAKINSFAKSSTTDCKKAKNELTSLGFTPVPFITAAGFSPSQLEFKWATTDLNPTYVGLSPAVASVASAPFGCTTNPFAVQTQITGTGAKTEVLSLPVGTTAVAVTVKSTTSGTVSYKATAEDGTVYEAQATSLFASSAKVLGFWADNWFIKELEIKCYNCNFYIAEGYVSKTLLQEGGCGGNQGCGRKLNMI